MLSNDAVILLLRRLRWTAAGTPAHLAQTAEPQFQALVLAEVGNPTQLLQRGRYRAQNIAAAESAGYIRVSSEVTSLTFDHFGTVRTATSRAVCITEAGVHALEHNTLRL